MQAHLPHFQPPLRRRAIAIAVLALVAGSAGGCAQQIMTPLPDLKKPAAADGMLQPSEQQKAIQEMARKKDDEQQQAIKQIEKSH